MRADDLVRTLRELGLNDADAAVYVTLARLGPTRAGDVAYAAGLGRLRTYRALERLTTSGWCRTLIGAPQLWEAEPPERVIARIRGEAANSLIRIERAGHALVQGLRPVHGQPGNDRRATFRVLHGRRNAFQAGARILRAATRSAQVVTVGPDGDAPEMRLYVSTMMSQVPAGVPVTVVAPPGPEDSDPSSPVASLTPRRARLPPARSQWLLVDETQLLIWVLHDARRGLTADRDVAVLTTAPGLVYPVLAAFGKVGGRRREPRRNPVPHRLAPVPLVAGGELFASVVRDGSPASVQRNDA